MHRCSSSSIRCFCLISSGDGTLSVKELLTESIELCIEFIDSDCDGCDEIWFWTDADVDEWVVECDVVLVVSDGGDCVGVFESLFDIVASISFGSNVFDSIAYVSLAIGLYIFIDVGDSGSM